MREYVRVWCQKSLTSGDCVCVKHDTHTDTHKRAYPSLVIRGPVLQAASLTLSDV